MNALIIEDELPAAKRLIRLLEKAAPEVQIAAVLDSVSGVMDWYKTNTAPHLLLMDIHLADGSAFDLLKALPIQAPIIFTTAYDEYAIEAFKTSGIDYLLKPVKEEELRRALDKLQRMGELQSGVMKPETPPVLYRKRFLIRFGEFIRTLLATDIAYCYSGHKGTFAKTTDGRNLPLDLNLDAMEVALNPQDFFRINRQYLVSLQAIGEMRLYTKGRVMVDLVPGAGEQPVVSSEKAAAFKKWLAGE